MIVLFDGRFLEPKRSGVGRYAFQIYERLMRLDRQNEYHLLSSSIHYSSHPLADLWEHLYVPAVAALKRGDLFFSPGFYIPRFSLGIKRLATIHDMGVWAVPDSYPAKFVLFMRAMIRMAVKRADAIITVSEAVKEDILRYLPWADADKIHPILNGIDEKFFQPPSPDAGDVLRNLSVDDEFMLYVGNIEPRKNLVNTMRAFREFKQKSGFNGKLVIVGQKGWLYQGIIEYGKRYQQDIVFTDYLTDEQVIYLYNQAVMVLFLSIYEGFGFPPLEAMAAGAPTLVSDIPTHREIYGDAAIFANPFLVQDIAEKMEKAYNDSSLRNELRKRGKGRASELSWDKTAEKTIELIFSLQ